jgi:hypothetical protein
MVTVYNLDIVRPVMSTELILIINVQILFVRVDMESPN